MLIICGKNFASNISCIEQGITYRHQEKILLSALFSSKKKDKMYTTVYDEKEKLWTGLCKVPFYNENLSVGQAILHSLESSPNKIGQVSFTLELVVHFSHTNLVIEKIS